MTKTEFQIQFRGPTLDQFDEYWYNGEQASSRNIKLKKRNQVPGENPLPVREKSYIIKFKMINMKFRMRNMKLEDREMKLKNRNMKSNKKNMKLRKEICS